MAVVADKVIVELEAKLDSYNANIARADQKFGAAMGSIQKGASATERVVTRAMGAMAVALASVSFAGLASAFLKGAEASKQLDAQLRLATATFGTFGQAQKDVQRIADTTRSGLSETAKLYANFVRGAQEIGASQADAARATETFSKTLKISGADTNQAASATLQFGQALAAGALRGDELNSILEASPRLARLLAQSMGQPIGQIKKLGEEGLLTSDKLLAALTDKKFTAGIDSEFQQMPVTFEEATTRIENAAITVFGAFDRGGEFSTALANFVGDGADGFQSLADNAEQLGIDVRSTLAGLADAFEPIRQAGAELFEFLTGRAEGFGIDFQASIRGTWSELDAIANFFVDIENAPRKLINKAFPGAVPLVARSNGLEAYDAGQQRERARLEGNRQQRRINDLLGGYDVMGNPLPGTPGARPGPRTVATGGGSKKKAARAPKSPLDADAFAREEASLNDQILRLKADGLQNAEDRAAAELARLEAFKAATIADLEGDKRYTAAQKDKIKALLGTVTALEEAKVIIERDTRIAKEALDFRIASLRNDQDLLSAQADLADTRAERRDIELRLLDLAYEMERAELDAVLASKEASEAQKKIAAARLAMLGRVQDARKEGIERQNEGPLERYRREIGNPDRANDQVEEAVIGELESVRDSISSAVQKTLGVKNPILAALINNFIEQQLIKPILDGMSGVGGGGVGLIGAIGGIFGFASGGSMTLGGSGGTDTNRLSLNGRPIANVSRGETLNIGTKALGRSGGGATVVQQITVDARNSVNPDGFARQILAISGQQAQAAATTMGVTVSRTIPQRMAQYGRDGT